MLGQRHYTDVGLRKEDVGGNPNSWRKRGFLPASDYAVLPPATAVASYATDVQCSNGTRSVYNHSLNTSVN